MNLVIVIDIFQMNKKKLSFTVTELYQMFIVMSIQREIQEENNMKPLCSLIEVPLNILCRVLKVIPKVTIQSMGKLAYHGFLDWSFVFKEGWRK